MRARSALFEAFEQAGFTLVRCTNHAIWQCPCGHAQVTSPTTPGRGRAEENTRALMTRTLNACNRLRRAA